MKATILIVDDNPDILFSFKAGAEIYAPSFEIHEAGTGTEALKMLENGLRPDLVLLDIMMPGLSGWDVAARMKSNPELEKIPIVFLTAKTDSLSKSMGSLSSEDYVEKPFEILDLIARIEAVLKKSRAS